MTEVLTETAAGSRWCATMPLAEAESQRLAALYRYGVLETGAEPAFDAITELAACICGTQASLISLVDRDRLWFKARTGFDGDCDCDSAPRTHAPCAQVIELAGDRPLQADPAGDPRFAAHPALGAAGGWRLYAGAPLVTPQGWAVGSLCVLDRASRSLSSRQQQALRLLAAQAVAQLELRRANALLDLQGNTDEVTGLWNRSAFERRLAQEWARWSRHGGSLALLAIDLDHFKHFNDVHGHSLGDEALQQAARGLEGELRGHDVLAHCGAGEFSVLMPSTDPGGALAVAERMRSALAALPWAVEPLTASIGVAVAAHGADVEPSALSRRAHRGLTHAKAQGRNCVELCLE
ncbi:GGDEF domain-containing protein [Methylibium sp.]|uniref:GGDEF domain-containing protein n=1 Tax=Methylibium sp. TaxID=2067992 RepID=UPI003D0D9812